MFKKQKNHISISSFEENDNSFNCLNQNSNTKNNNKLVTSHTNNKNISQYLNKLILISLKHKKFLERNDYFYSQLCTKNKMKKVKLKLTPFQQYEQYKNFSKKLQLNNKIINSFRPNDNDYKYRLKNKQLNNIFTSKNENRYLRKNKTQNNNKFCLTSSHQMYQSNSKIKKKEKIYINSLDINLLSEPKIKKNKYSSVSYDTYLNINKNNKMKIINKYKMGLRNLSNKDDNSLYEASKTKRSIGILTSAAFRPLKIINIKSRNNRILGLPKISVDNKKYQVPLIHMDNSKFLNEITNYK